MLTVNTNVASLQAQKNLSSTQASINKSIDHLSAGLRITSASDDAAGLEKSMVLQGQIASYNAAAKTTQTAIAQTQTAEGYLNEVGNILTRLRELKVGGDDGQSTEFTALTTELNRVGTLISNIATISASVDVDGSQKTLAVKTAWTIDATTTATGKINTTKLNSVTSIDAAIKSVAGWRATAGATSNVLTAALGTLQTAATNTAGVNSSIMDVDVAEETAKLSRSQVLAQAGVSVLAQANQLPQMALKLLG